MADLTSAEQSALNKMCTAANRIASGGLGAQIAADETRIGACEDGTGIDADAIKDTHIDWGTGATQVSAGDMPIADGGGLITGTTVEAALAENRAAIDASEADIVNLMARVNDNVQLVFPLPGTLGCDTGPATNPCSIYGAITPKDPGAATYGGVVAQHDVDGSPVVTNYSTEAAEATDNDVLPFPTSPAIEDYAIFGAEVPFFGVLIGISTQANMVATTVWEYSDDVGDATSFATLTPLFDATTALQVAGTGNKLVAFVPPADWAAVAPADTIVTALYQLRCRISAFTSSTTEPLIDQVWFLHAVGDGVKSPVTGAVDKVTFNFNTESGSTADSIFLLVNVTAGTYKSFTKTKATSFQEVAGALAVTEADELVLVQVTEDGSTEFANGSAVINIVPTAVT